MEGSLAQRASLRCWAPVRELLVLERSTLEQPALEQRVLEQRVLEPSVSYWEPSLEPQERQPEGQSAPGTSVSYWEPSLE